MFRTMTDRYDVIVVGSRAGGGMLAHTVAPSGKKILLLERGDFLPRELANWDADAVFVDGPAHLPRHRSPGWHIRPVRPVSAPIP